MCIFFLWFNRTASETNNNADIKEKKTKLISLYTLNFKFQSFTEGI